MQCARKHGVIISYDLNYREFQTCGVDRWKEGWPRKSNLRIAPNVDVQCLAIEKTSPAALA